jgi:hypothetical protein
MGGRVMETEDLSNLISEFVLLIFAGGGHDVLLEKRDGVCIDIRFCARLLESRAIILLSRENCLIINGYAEHPIDTGHVTRYNLQYDQDFRRPA